jgi:aspartate/methionine/tyrosine aminotransferase
MAAVEALTGPQDPVTAMVEEFRRRRALVVEGLAALPGVRVHEPGGAFYAFPDVSGTGMSGSQLAERLLLDAGVSVLSVTAFGGAAPNSLRISYANSQANIRRALERMATLLERQPAPA